MPTVSMAGLPPGLAGAGAGAMPPGGPRLDLPPSLGGAGPPGGPRPEHLMSLAAASGGPPPGQNGPGGSGPPPEKVYSPASLGSSPDSAYSIIEASLFFITNLLFNKRV